MEIHAPEGPTRSFREFSIHILIVTIGILIALGLEGIRETIHEHHSLDVTRKTFQWELKEDLGHMTLETANVQQKNAALDSVLHDYDQLVRSPDQLQKRVDSLEPSFYLFGRNAWTTATASGVLNYMEPEELSRYSEAYTDIEIYQPISRNAMIDWAATKGFFDSRTSYSPQDAMEGKQRLIVLQTDLRGMGHLDHEFLPELNKALALQ